MKVLVMFSYRIEFERIRKSWISSVTFLANAIKSLYNTVHVHIASWKCPSLELWTRSRGHEQVLKWKRTYGTLLTLWQKYPMNIFFVSIKNVFGFNRSFHVHVISVSFRRLANFGNLIPGFVGQIRIQKRIERAVYCENEERAVIHTRVDLISWKHRIYVTSYTINMNQ